MMTAKLHHRISRLLQRTITNFCRDRISFDRKLHVVGLVALNIDDDEVDVLVKMDKTFTKENDDMCDEDDDEEDVETMEFDGECKPIDGYSPVVLVDSSTSATTNVDHGQSAETVTEFDEDDCEVSSPMETREEADTNFCSLEDEVVPLPPPLSSVIADIPEEADDVDDDMERIQVHSSTSIVTPLFHHKQKRKRFRPMRLYQPVNGLVLSSATSLADGSHSSEEPPSPSPYLPPPPASNADFTLLPELVGASPTDSLKASMDLPLPPLPSSDTASGEEEEEDTRAIVLNGIDSCGEIPLSPVSADVVEEVRPSEEDEDLQITGEFCRQPQQSPSLLPLMSTLPPPPPLTSVTLPLLSLPLAGHSSALNSIPLIPLRQVSSQSTPRQFALITAPGTGILLPSSLQQQQQQNQSTTILATAVTKNLTVTATVPGINSSAAATLSTVNSIISSLAASSSAPTTSTTNTTTTTSSSTAPTTTSSSSSSKSKALSVLSSGSGRSRRNSLKFHHSPITIPAAAAALRPLPTMTSGSSVASSLMRHYNCRYCGKMFNRKFCLERHERLHTGVKPYACSCCGERFIRLEDKKRHVRTVHEPAPPGGGLGEEKGGVENSVSTSGASSAHMLSIISAVAAAAAAGNK